MFSVIGNKKFESVGLNATQNLNYKFSTSLSLANSAMPVACRLLPSGVNTNYLKDISSEIT